MDRWQILSPKDDRGVFRGPTKAHNHDDITVACGTYEAMQAASRLFNGRCELAPHAPPSAQIVDLFEALKAALVKP